MKIKKSWRILREEGFIEFLKKARSYLTDQSQNWTRAFDIHRGDMVIDVGACVGEFSTQAAEKVGKNGKVIAIEPESKNFEKLKKKRKICKT